MQRFELIAPCHFGMESVLKQEIYDLGYEITEVSDGRVSFAGDEDAIARANISLRTAERILLKVGSFHASTFDELYEGTRALPWNSLLPSDAKFWVTKASSVKSALFSPSDIQSIMKKAMVDNMNVRYHRGMFPEDGAAFPVRVFLYKDVVTVGIDTTGESLHKRGYRKLTVKAPIAENLAAGLLMLTPWRADRILVDPFCGSGTIPIEAALMAANIAPGLSREFTAEKWTGILSPRVWKDVRDEAGENIDLSVDTDIQGYDIDPDAIACARENARSAGVEKLIHLQVRSVAQLSHPKKYGFILTNPPYGERIASFTPGSNTPISIAQARGMSESAHDASDKEEIEALYRTLGERFRALDAWSLYVITSFEDCERAIGLKAAKNRKIYNGMLKTYFYMFPGPKPSGHRQG
ncbi:MAG: class I SAM-dependent RNA methyltransferase [Lachnospiraceae bacterium]|jgi:putative N6-adenine-specific DNA methylase|nr:class I SAM-dependent RNA methyltransferase [Lachnospiraceae bacterium]